MVGSGGAERARRRLSQGRALLAAMRTKADAALELRARAQHGVFTRSDAKASGHSARTIKRRVEERVWERIYPGVYTFPAIPPSWLRDQSAAARWAPGLAAGQAAAFLHGLPGFDDPPIEVLTHNNKVVPHSGIRIHVTTRLPREHVAIVQNIPCTSIERTLLDLCGQVRRRRAAIALDHALHRGLTTLGALDHCLYLTARRGRNGCGVLRELVKARLDLREFPNSPLETVVFDMIAGSGLPYPELQHEIFDDAGRFVARPDFVYPAEKLVVEAHSKLWHDNKEVASHDAAKYRRLKDLGYEVAYVTWADATEYSTGTLRKIEVLLDSRRWRGGARSDPLHTAARGA